MKIYELKQDWREWMLLVEIRHPSKHVYFHFHGTVQENASISRQSSERERFDVIPPNQRQILVLISRQHAFRNRTPLVMSLNTFSRPKARQSLIQGGRRSVRRISMNLHRIGTFINCNRFLPCLNSEELEHLPQAK